MVDDAPTRGPDREIDRLLSGHLDPIGVARRIVDTLRELLGARVAVLYRVDEVGNALRAVVGSGDLGLAVIPGLSVPWGVGVIGRCVAERRPFQTPNVLGDPRVRNTPELRAWVQGTMWRSALGLPLVIGDLVTGALGVGDLEGRVFAEDEILLAQAFASQAAVSLGNARLYEIARRDAARMTALVEIERLLSERLDPAVVARRIADTLRELLGARSTILYRLREYSGDLEVVAASGDIAPAVRIPGFVVPRGTAVVGRAVAERQPVQTPNLFTSPGVAITPGLRVVLEATGLLGVLALPLVIGDRVMGALSVADPEGRIFAEDEIALTQVFARQASISLENARLYEEAERRRQEAESLAEVGRLISQSLEVGEVADRIVHSVSGLFGGTMAVLYRLEPTGDLTMLAGVGEGVDWNRRLGRGTATVGLALSERRTVATTDVLEDPRIVLDPEARARMARSGYRAVLAVPLVVQDRAIGALGIGDRGGRAFTPREIELAEAFARHAALAIDNARLYEEARRAYEDLSRTQAQLAHSQKMEAVGRLAGGIAHEFNNLLTVILGRIELLLHRSDAGPVTTQLEMVRKTAGRAAELTRQLLAFSRRQIARPRLLDLNGVVTSTTDLLLGLVREDIQLLFHPGPSLGLVSADPGQISQVLVNLVVNARDAMPSGGRLTIETANVTLGDADCRGRAGASPGPYVMLAVNDTGSGMSAETLSRIFEPFFTTKEVGQGSGLGLSMVYGIVTQNGGAIDVESAPGAGSRFRIYLPRVTGTVDDDPGAVAASRTDVGGSETILIAEDEDEVREFVAHALETRGFVVLAARDGVEALRLADEHHGRIDLLLTDAVMPRMGGRELAERFAATRPESKILYMSGHTDDVVIRAGLSTSGPAFLPKPFTPETLAESVRSVLDRDARR